MTREEIDKTLKEISDLLYLLRCNMTSITRYVRCEEENPNRESYKKLADTAIDNILNAINKDLNKDYKEHGEEVARLQKAEESAQEASIEYYNLYKDYKRKYDDLRYRETDMLKEFVEWYKKHLNDFIKYEKNSYADVKNNKHEDITAFFAGRINMLITLLGGIDTQLYLYLEENEDGRK